MEKCGLCMTEINKGATVCTGCGAYKEACMSFFPKMLFWFVFLLSLPMAVQLSDQIGWFALAAPLAIMGFALIYYNTFAKAYWTRKN